ncbi:hypothetical protein JCM10908_001308 [Rhodotorula pacifica]|uniref:PP2C family serine/threonine-protein phosphatase n=1 Tax=Rhodotorula pacifica TaxID=1495444 RepID=UPI003179CA47
MTSPPALKIDVEAVNTQAAQLSGTSSSAPIHRPVQGGLNRLQQQRAGTPSADAQTTEQTTAEGKDTFGVVNRHPVPVQQQEHDDNDEPGFTVGVSVDRNKKCRRTMEDAHSFIYDFGGIRGQGYFAVFDGHAGKHAAEWCGHNFHLHLLDHLRKAPSSTPVPDLLNSTFLVVDTKLSELAIKGGTHSGCTAVTCFLRLEDEEGNPAGDASGVAGEVVPLPSGGAQADLLAEVDEETPLKVARQLEKQEEAQGGAREGMDAEEERRRRRDKDPLDPFDGGRDTTADELRTLREDEEDHKAATAVQAEAEREAETSTTTNTTSSSSPSKDLKQRIKDMLGVSSSAGTGNSSSSAANSNAPAPATTPGGLTRPSLGQRESSLAGRGPGGGGGYDHGHHDSTSSSDKGLPSEAISATSEETPTPTPTSSTTSSKPALSSSEADPDPDRNSEPEKPVASLIPSSPSLPPVFTSPAVSLPRSRAPRRTLYTANVGDARAVLSRAGKAVRLTYDHKGSDAKEAKRISDKGGYVLNNRVNGVLAVTRSLGDSSMKEFVVGSPYTTETKLGPNDDFLIVACDGLWDVCTDQEAVDLVADCADDAQAASQKLLDHALNNFSTDNLSVLVVSLHPPSKASQRREESTRDQGAGMIANP